VTTRVHPSADVDPSASIGEGSAVWHLAQVREDAVLGEGCIIGRGAYIGTGVQLGDHVKVQNHALVYEPARLGDGVFIGPAAVLTNDRRPRSIDPSGQLKRGDDWEAAGITVHRGAAVGAHATVVAGVTIGEWAMVGAGAIVTRDVPAHALVVGNPARRIAWVGRAGHRLEADETGTDRWHCPVTGERYGPRGDGLVLESDEESNA
jgi:UDP-2-acetamido-3-amino-2,3-dideoxy-glucuronate N-acetyltransferase